MSEDLVVAIVGATGLVGQTLINILIERNFPVGKLILLASERSLGKKVVFKDQTIPVQDLNSFDFAGVDLAFFSAGGEVSKVFVPKATSKGCLVIDNTSTFRYDSEIPLVIPEVNPEALLGWRKHHIIANPNCSTIQMLVALYPLHKAANIKRIQVSTYQSASGAGLRAMEALKRQTSDHQDDSGAFYIPLGYNLIPQIDVFQPNGYTKEEMKMVWETHKILNNSSIEVNPTAVRVPVMIGHSESVYIETEAKLSSSQARELLSRAPGVVVKDRHEPGGYPSPLLDAQGTDPVYVGRIREDLYHRNGLNLWIVSDNIRKGAALNSIQIAETWLRLYK